MAETDHRTIAQQALRAYSECGHGRWRLVTEHTNFDHQLLAFRLDIEKTLAQLTTAERCVLRALSEGYNHAEALAVAGIRATRPDAVVARIETRAGKLLQAAGLGDLTQYFQQETCAL